MPHPREIEIRDRVRELVEIAGGQRAAARVSGVPQPNISDYLAGKCDMTTSTLNRLVRACRGSIDISSDDLPLPGAETDVVKALRDVACILAVHWHAGDATDAEHARFEQLQRISSVGDVVERARAILRLADIERRSPSPLSDH